MNEPRPSYEELEARLARAEELIAALKGSEVDAVLGREDIAFVRERSAEERARAFQAELERQVAERTELAEARAMQLQAMAGELLEAEERERRRIAQILHDDLQQHLASAKLQLQSVDQYASNDPILIKIEGLLKDCLAKTCSLSQELSPPVLSHSGLSVALEWLAQHLKERFGFVVQLEIDTEACFENETFKIFLFRAVQELLFNSVKHAGVKNARVSLSNSDGRLFIAVSDQGIGFNADLKSFSAKNGLGLLCLRERAQFMGGELTIKGAPGQGSCFTLTIPLPKTREKIPGDPGLSKAPRPRNRAIDASADENIRVLIVDDHKVMRQALSTILRKHPEIHVAGQASNGWEAVEKVRDLSLDLVLMDVSMPGLNGVEATRIIKAERPEVCIIGLSMYDDDQLVQKMQQAGAEQFISKSVSSSQLLQTIYKTVRCEYK
ncbi:MAG: response regulator [Desulfosalsimonadaceae bacterium]